MSNYPPGVTGSMIPGNRPEDVLYDQIYELVEGELLSRGIDPYSVDLNWIVDAAIDNNWDGDSLEDAALNAIEDELRSLDGYDNFEEG